MKNLLWLIAVVCFLVWMMGLIGVGAGLLLGTSIHILLIIPLLVVFYSVISDLKRNS